MQKLDKNSKMLKDFIKYCKKHPTQRFWQSLRNWADVEYIMMENKGQKWDTFYFNGNRPHYFDYSKPKDL